MSDINCHKLLRFPVVDSNPDMIGQYHSMLTAHSRNHPLLIHPSTYRVRSKDGIRDVEAMGSQELVQHKAMVVMQSCSPAVSGGHSPANPVLVKQKSLGSFF